MKKILITVIIPLILIGGVIWLFGTKTSTPQTSLKPRVLTTIFPLYDFTRAIAGDKIELTNLLPPNVGPHDFSITPEEAKKIATADIFIINGVGDLETWLAEALGQSAKADLVIVNTAEGAHLVETGQIVSLNGIELTETDPHIWLDPENAIVQIENITRALTRLDKDNAAAYEANAQKLAEQIRALENEYLEKIKKLPRRDFLAFHNAFNHLAYRFQLNQVGVFEEFPGKEPTPKELIKIIQTIENKKIKTLFSEPQFSPKIVEAVARDLNLEILPLNPLDTGDFTTDNYLKIMRQNLDHLLKAFSL